MTNRAHRRRRRGGIVDGIQYANPLGLKGRVTVEILDERGRVCSRQEAPNYVNQSLFDRFVQVSQRIPFAAGVTFDTANVTNDPIYQRDPRILPGFPFETLACWSDSTAEDNTDVHPWGNLIAWAHRWPQASPTTRQGIISPSLCTVDEDSVKLVWEWTTTNGNGTFQSVGFRRLVPFAITGDPILWDYVRHARRLYTSTGWVVHANALSSNPYVSFSGQSPTNMPTYYDSATGDLVAVADCTGGRRLIRCPVTLSGKQYAVGTAVDSSATAIAAGLGGDAVAATTRLIMGITRLGASGDWIGVGCTGTTTARRPTIRRVTPAGSVSYTNANGATFTGESTFFDVTYDGTNLWAVGYNVTGPTSRLYRIDPATGNVSATVTVTPPDKLPTFDTATTFITGMEWDAANSCLWVLTRDGYIFACDTSGNPLGAVYSTAAQPSNFTLGAPYSTTIKINQGRSNSSEDGWRMIPSDSGDGTNLTSPWATSVFGAAVGDVVSPVSGSGGLGGRLITMDGNIWRHLLGTSGAQNTIAMWAFASVDEEAQFFSRSLLGSPAVKNSTQTMRISYTITFV